MPGAGKSTVGVLLAKKTARSFVDTDILIQKQCGCRLQEIIEAEGYLRLRAIEEQVIIDFSCSYCVVATGGSAVYSNAAMQHLKRDGVLVYLDVPFEEIERRVHDYGARGIARRPEQSFRDLFEERRPLYQRHADITVPAYGMGIEAVCGAISKALGE